MQITFIHKIWIFILVEKIKDYDVESFHFFDQDSTNLYSFRKFTNDYYLEIYRKDSLTRIAEITLPLPSRDSIKYSLESLFIGKETFKVFYSYFDEKCSLEKLEMVRFNKVGLIIGEVKLIDSSIGKSHKKAGDFSIINRPAYNEFLSFGYKHSKDTTFINIDLLVTTQQLY